ncbi:MAG: PAS domain-containing protein [Candidatus Peregrinibacteria bacterium]
MLTLSQNKKIAISAIAIFAVSFMFMLFFLETGGIQTTTIQTDAVHVNESSIAEASLEAAYREYLSDKDAPMVVIDVEGKVKYASADFCSMLSVKCDALTGHSLFDHINSKDMAEFVSSHSKLISEGEKLEGIGPYRISGNDGELLVMLSAYPVLNKKNKVIEIIFSAKDLTEQVEELNKNTDNDPGPAWIKHIYPDSRLMVDKII